MKKLLLGLVASVAAGAFANIENSISDVVVQQQWPWSNEVLVSFKVSGLASNEAIDPVLKGRIGSKTIDIPEAAIKANGLKKCLENGMYTMSFNPMEVPELVAVKGATDFRMEVEPATTAFSMTEPLYMIVDLTKNAGDSDQVTYLSRADILTGNYGTYERTPSWIQNTPALDDCLIWTGVTNYVYKTDKLVMRRIKAGSFVMGSPEGEPGRKTGTWSTGNPGFETQHQVTFTKDFWMGVFEMTTAQCNHIKNLGDASSALPIIDSVANSGNLNYNVIRGTTEAVKWPSNADAMDNVDSDSILGMLRTKTGNTAALKFDLPTEAQWEYACRAGTTTTFNNGKAATGDTKTDEEMLSEIAWNTDEWRRTLQEVGLKKPNAWGLYDMHSNASELCVDWFKPDLGAAAVTDPLGPGQWDQGVPYFWDSVKHCLRGGHVTYGGAPTGKRSAYRFFASPSESRPAEQQGFRLAITINE